MRGQGQDLFDLIAECMSDFIHRKGFQNQKIYCGFTFSFPVDQTSIKSASLIQWTKGFCAEGVEGQDVVAMLEKALSDRGDIDCEILAVLNDTVGTMMSCAFEDQSTEIGLIAGTGSNACYFEDRFVILFCLVVMLIDRRPVRQNSNKNIVSTNNGNILIRIRENYSRIL